MEEVNRIELTCMAVGQGLGNLAEYYNKEGELIYLALFDFGCFNAADNELARAPQSIGYAARKMEERCAIEQQKKGVDQTGGMFLDLVVISHQDEDHWLLLNELLEMASADAYLYKEKRADGCYMKRRQMNNGISETIEGWAQDKENGINTLKTDMNYDTETLGMEGYRNFSFDKKTGIFKEKSEFEMCVNSFRRDHGEIAAVSNETALLGLAEETLDETRNMFYVSITGKGETRIDLREQKAFFSRSVTFENENGDSYTYQEEGDYGPDAENWTVRCRQKPPRIPGFAPRFTALPHPNVMIDSSTVDLSEFISGQPEERPEGNILIGRAVVGGSLLCRSDGFEMFLGRLKQVSMELWELGRGFFKRWIPSPLKNIKFYIVCCLTSDFGTGKVEGIESTNDEAICRNYSSAVVLMLIQGGSYGYEVNYGILFPGDATTHTMNYMLRSCMGKGNVGGLTYWMGAGAYTENILAFVPHHGSAHTNQGYYIVQKKPQPEPPEPPDTFMIFKSYLNVLAARRSQVSSGMDSFNERFHHPDKMVVMLIDEEPYLSDEEPEGTGKGNHILLVWNSEGNTEPFYTVKANNGTIGSVLPEEGMLPDPQPFHHHYTILCENCKVIVAHTIEESLPEE